MHPFPSVYCVLIIYDITVSEQYVVELSGLPYFYRYFIKPRFFSILIFLSTESSCSCINCPSLMSNCLLIILVIGSCVTFEGYPSKLLFL